MMKKLLIAALLGAPLGSIALPAGAAAIVVQVAPPPPRAEAVPAPRRGYVWVPGYWDWRGNRHVWVAGSWMREKHGYHYQQPRWEEHDGHWQMQRGNWARGDRDGDGVPDRVDRQPNNPARN